MKTIIGTFNKEPKKGKKVIGKPIKQLRKKIKLKPNQKLT